jgi:outer membrane protease
VQLLSPQTLNAQFKKHAYELPASLNKYQHDAYKTACAALLKAEHQAQKSPETAVTASGPTV